MMTTDGQKFLTGSCIILLASVLLRLVHLEADTPWDFGSVHAITIDPAWYSDHALSKIRGIESHLSRFSYDKFVFTFWVHQTFKLFGVGFASLNSVSIVPGVLSILFLGLILRKTLGTNFALLAMLLASVNFFFFVFSRTGLIYVTLCLFTVLSIYFFQRGLSKKFFFILAYGALFVAAFGVKFYILVLLPFFLFLHPGKRKIFYFLFLPLLLFLLVKSGLFQLTLHKASIYLTDLNPFLFKNSLVKIARENSLKIYKWFWPEMLLAYLYCFMFLFRKKNKGSIRDQTDTLMIIFLLTIHGCFFFMKFLPPRFFVFLIPSVIYLCTSCIFEISRMTSLRDLTSILSEPRNRWLIALGLFVLNFHLSCVLFTGQMLRHFLAMSFAIMAFSLLFLQASHFFLTKLPENAFPPKKHILLILTAILLINGYHFWSFLSEPAYSTKLAIKELSLLMPSSARVGGMYAHILGLNSGFQKFRFTFQAPKIAPKKSLEQQLDQKKITYLFIDRAHSWRLVEKFHPSIHEEIHFFASIFVRGTEIQIYRYKEAKPLIPKEEISLSLYQKGVKYLEKNDRQKGIPFLKQSLEKNPYNAHIWFHLSQELNHQGKTLLAVQALKKAVENAKNTPTLLQNFIKYSEIPFNRN